MNKYLKHDIETLIKLLPAQIEYRGEAYKRTLEQNFKGNKKSRLAYESDKKYCICEYVGEDLHSSCASCLSYLAERKFIII